MGKAYVSHDHFVDIMERSINLIKKNAKKIAALETKISVMELKTAQLDTENALHRPLGPTPSEPPEFKMPLTVADLRGNKKRQ